MGEDDVEEVVLFLDDDIQQKLKENGYTILEKHYHDVQTFFQIKKNNEIFDLGIFSEVYVEDIKAIKEGEEEFGHLKDSIELRSKNQVN